MTADEWRELTEQLVQKLPHGLHSAEVLAPGEQPGTLGSDAAVNGSQGLRTLEELMARASRRLAVPGQATPRRVAPVEARTASSPVRGALRTAAMLTGAGPIVSGVLKVLRSGSPSPVSAELPVYGPPPSASIEAGLRADRSFVQIDHALGGMPRKRTPERSTLPAQIHIQVQAMDSRSFLDHSDDIARAVRHAMLQSNALNDVVTEL